MKIGQLVGYAPRGPQWRARITAIERDGQSYLAEIPVVDEHGEPILYEEPPPFVSRILDYEHYFLVEDVKGVPTEPWLAARLDHKDLELAWKSLADRIGLREPYYHILSSVLERWAPPEQRGDLLDDLLVLLHAAWRTGASTENAEVARLIDRICQDRGAICLSRCTHPEDAQAIRNRGKEPL